MTAAPLVSVQGLRVEFPTRAGSIVAVQDIGFDIFPNEVLCIVGESGSGKSVTAQSLMGLNNFLGGRIAEGRLAFVRRDGCEVDLGSADEWQMQAIRGNEIGMIFQEPVVALNPCYTIGWQLAECLRIHKGVSRKAADDKSLELLERVLIPEPDRRLKQYPHEMSGGMCQRVVIAMALACEPRLLIADEPTTALDVTVQAEILALIDMLRRRTGAAVLLITHDMAVVARMADRVVVMYGGEIVEVGTVRQVLARPRHAYTRELLSAVPRMGEMAGTTGPRRMRVIGEEDQVGESIEAGSETRLDVANLTKRFPVRGGVLGREVASVHAVEDVSLYVRKNETLALVGESGSGKTTVGRCILRLEEPDSGHVTFNGRDLLTLSASAMRAERRNMQVIFQDPHGSLNPQMRLIDQVAEPIRNFGLVKGGELEDRVAMLFDRVRMPRAYLRNYPSELSGGQRQRVAIARALALNPSFIVADEAVSALDVSIQAQVLNLMMELQSDLGLSYLFISHDMAVVERVSHRVAVMYQGRIVEVGPRPCILENPQHEYTRTLLSAVPKLDPDIRTGDLEPESRSVPSPIHPSGFQPEPSRYVEVSSGHHVLLNDHP